MGYLVLSVDGTLETCGFDVSDNFQHNVHVPSTRTIMQGRFTRLNKKEKEKGKELNH
jgi:hypothetical protein